MMELWDAYYADSSLAGVDLVRGESIEDGLYHVVSDIFVMHKDGSILLMQRETRKPSPDNMKRVPEEAFSKAKHHIRELFGNLKKKQVFSPII